MGSVKKLGLYPELFSGASVGNPEMEGCQGLGNPEEKKGLVEH